jgi:hypothetical protein
MDYPGERKDGMLTKMRRPSNARAKELAHEEGVWE